MKIPDSDRKTCRDISSNPNHDRVTASEQDGNKRGKLCLKTTGTQSSGTILVHSATEAHSLTLFTSEDLDDRQSVDILCNNICHLPSRLRCLFRRCLDTSGVYDNNYEKRR